MGWRGGSLSLTLDQWPNGAPSIDDRPSSSHQHHKNNIDDFWTDFWSSSLVHTSSTWSAAPIGWELIFRIQLIILLLNHTGESRRMFVYERHIVQLWHGGFTASAGRSEISLSNDADCLLLRSFYDFGCRGSVDYTTEASSQTFLSTSSSTS